MKNIITILILIIAFTSCRAQQIVNINTFNQGGNNGKYFKDIDNNFPVFIGTWENTTGNLTFRVVLTKTTKKNYITRYMDKIEGRFLIIENAGTINENIVHNSVKDYPQSGQTSTYVITGATMSGIYFHGLIDDNSIDDNTIGILTGQLSMEIINTGNSPLQAHWKVFRKGISIQGLNFNVPTDIIMTKVN